MLENIEITKSIITCEIQLIFHIKWKLKFIKIEKIEKGQ